MTLGVLMIAVLLIVLIVRTLKWTELTNGGKAVLGLLWGILLIIGAMFLFVDAEATWIPFAALVVAAIAVLTYFIPSSGEYGE